jgi:alpha-L-fucosidase
MQINQEAIHGTRPWKIMGEGPQVDAAGKPDAGNLSENGLDALSAQDVRFTTKGTTLYAFVMGVPKTTISIKALGTASKLYDGPIGSVTLVGSDETLTWKQTTEVLTIEAPRHVPNDIAIALKITPRS